MDAETAEPMKDEDVVWQNGADLQMTASFPSKQLPCGVRFVLGTPPD